MPPLPVTRYPSFRSSLPPAWRAIISDPNYFSPFALPCRPALLRSTQLVAAMPEKWLQPDIGVGSPAAGEAGDSGSDGVFDEDDFMQRNMHDEELGRDVISLYIVSAADSLTFLQEALAAGDAKGVRELAHSLKGASATISAPAMHRMAAELEMAGKDGELGHSGLLLRGLNDEFERLKGVLERRGWHRRHPAPRD